MKGFGVLCIFGPDGQSTGGIETYLSLFTGGFDIGLVLARLEKGSMGFKANRPLNTDLSCFTVDN